MRKIVNNKGFTLLEMLACIVTLLLIAAICTTGMNFAMRSFNESIYESDAQMLESTLNLYLCDILRHATIEEEEVEDAEKPVENFTNSAYQIYAGNIKLSETAEGEVVTYLVYETKKSDIIIGGKNVYGNTLYVSDFKLFYNSAKHYFTGSYIIKSTILENAERECTFTCRTIAEY